LEIDYDVSKLTSFKIGGTIKKVYFPTSVFEFEQILKAEPNAKVFGNLSNTLVSSFGYNEVVIITTKMTDIKINGTRIIVECGVKGPKLSQVAAENGLSGFEFMIGFPGSIGGNICMKALEGTAKNMARMLKQEIKASLGGKIGYLFMKKNLKRFAKRMDTKEVGGAMIFGIGKPVVKAHGNSDGYAFSNAIKQVRLMIKSNLIEKVTSALPVSQKGVDSNE